MTWASYGKLALIVCYQMIDVVWLGVSEWVTKTAMELRTVCVGN